MFPITKKHPGHVSGVLLRKPRNRQGKLYYKATTPNG
jgi:hypothetical protein